MGRRDPSEFRNLKDWINEYRYGEWITTKEAAKKYNFTPGNIRYLCHAKECIIVHKKGRDLLINRQSLADFMQKRKELQ